MPSFFASKRPGKMVIKYSCSNSTNHRLLQRLREATQGVHPAALLAPLLTDVSSCLTGLLGRWEGHRASSKAVREAGQQTSCMPGGFSPESGKRFEGGRSWGELGEDLLGSDELNIRRSFLSSCYQRGCLINKNTLQGRRGAPRTQ